MWMVSDTGMGTYYPRVRRDRGVCPCRNPRRAMAPEALANRQISQWDTGFHTLQGGIEPAFFFCGFGLLEL